MSPALRFVSPRRRRRGSLDAFYGVLLSRRWYPPRRRQREGPPETLAAHRCRRTRRSLVKQHAAPACRRARHPQLTRRRRGSVPTRRGPFVNFAALLLRSRSHIQPKIATRTTSRPRGTVFRFLERPVWKSKFYGAFVLNHRVVLHAIDAMSARWNRVHPTHWLISTHRRTGCGSRRRSSGRRSSRSSRGCPCLRWEKQ